MNNTRWISSRQSLPVYTVTLTLDLWSVTFTHVCMLFVSLLLSSYCVYGCVETNKNPLWMRRWFDENMSWPCTVNTYICHLQYADNAHTFCVCAWRCFNYADTIITSHVFNINQSVASIRVMHLMMVKIAWRWRWSSGHALVSELSYSRWHNTSWYID